MMQPENARAFWHRSVEMLADCAESSATPRTVGLAGSALEAAGIYLLAASEPRTRDISLYADTALMLIGLLLEARENRLAIVVLAGTSAVLEHLALQGCSLETCVDASKRLAGAGMRRIRVRGTPAAPRPAATLPAAKRPALTAVPAPATVH